MYVRLGFVIGLCFASGALPAQGQPPRTDLHGDPLPAGAVARLGTERLRTGRDTNALVFTGDGKLLASIHDDAHVELWDSTTGARRGRLSVSADGRLRFLACSADGKYLAAGDEHNHCLWIWNLGTDQPPRQLKGHTGGPQTVAFSPDGKTLASASHYANDKKSDDTVRLWDSATGKPLRLINGPKYGTTSVAFLSGGKCLVGAGYDCVLRVWDVAEGKELSRHELPERSMTVQPLPDGKTVATLVWKDRASVIDLWDLAAGKLVWRRFYPELDYPGLVAPPIGNDLALFGTHGVSLLSAATGKIHRRLASHDMFGAAAFSPDGKRLAAATMGRIHIWDPITGKEQTTPDGPDDRVLFARFLPGDRQIVTTNRDRTLRLWDAVTGKQIRNSTIESDPQSAAIDLSPDGKTLAIPHLAGNTVVLWDVAGGKPRRTYRVGDFTQTLQFRFSPDGKVLAVASMQRAQNVDAMSSILRIHLMEVATGKVRQVLNDEFSPIMALLVSADGKRLVVTSRDEDGYSWTAWAMATGRKLHEERREGQPLFFLADGSLAVATDDPEQRNSSVFCWDLNTGKRTPRLPAGPSGDGLGMTADRYSAVIGDGPWTERPLILRDLRTGKLLGRLDHGMGVATAIFTDDGERLATVGWNHTLLVWDMSVLRKVRAARRTPLSAADLENLWQALGTASPEQSLEVFDRLVEAPEAVVVFLHDQLAPVSDAGLADRIADLDATAFAKRDRAMQELRHMEFAALPALKMVLAGKPSLEVRRRAEMLVKELEEPAAPQHLRRWRAMTVLEQIDSPAGRQLLQALAKGAPAARLTRDAQTALQRLATDKEP